MANWPEQLNSINERLGLILNDIEKIDFDCSSANILLAAGKVGLATEELRAAIKQKTEGK